METTNNTTKTTAIVSSLIALRVRNGKSESAKTGAPPNIVRAERLQNVFDDLFACCNGGGYQKGRNPAKLAEWTEFYKELDEKDKAVFRRELASACAVFVDERTAKEIAANEAVARKEKRQSMTYDVMSLLS